MNTGSVVALFVSVLGTFVILSLVFLVYKWRATRCAPHSPIIDQEAGTPPMQQYRLRRGRLVPKAYTQSILSSRSGWSTIRHPTILFTSKPPVKADQVSIKTVQSRSTTPALQAKAISIKTHPVSEKSPVEIQHQPKPSVTSAPARRESTSKSSYRSSFRSIRQSRRWPEDTIYEADTPPSEPSVPVSPPTEPSEADILASRRQTFLDPPSRDSFHQPPPLPKPVPSKLLQSRYSTQRLDDRSVLPPSCPPAPVHPPSSNDPYRTASQSSPHLHF